MWPWEWEPHWLSLQLHQCVLETAYKDTLKLVVCTHTKSMNILLKMLSKCVTIMDCPSLNPQKTPEDPWPPLYDYLQTRWSTDPVPTLLTYHIWTAWSIDSFRYLVTPYAYWSRLLIWLRPESAAYWYNYEYAYRCLLIYCGLLICLLYTYSVHYSCASSADTWLLTVL